MVDPRLKKDLIQLLQQIKNNQINIKLNKKKEKEKEKMKIKK